MKRRPVIPFPEKLGGCKKKTTLDIPARLCQVNNQANDTGLEDEPNVNKFLQLPHEHAFSVKLASQVESVSNEESVAGVKMLSSGLLEILIQTGDKEGYGCRSWPIRVGGMGLTIEEVGLSNQIKIIAPVSVRFGANISHVNVDIEGFVDDLFWEGIYAYNKGNMEDITLKDIIYRVLIMMKSPFFINVTSTASTSSDGLDEIDKILLKNWKSAELFTYNKIQNIKRYQEISLSPYFVENGSIWKPEWIAKEFLSVYSLASSSTSSISPLTTTTTATTTATTTSTSFWKDFVLEISPGVYTFPIFTESFCELFISELNNYEQSGLPRRRPNTMNNYGLILNDIGMESLFTSFMNIYLLPIIQELFSNEIVTIGLDHHHSFIVQYKATGRGDIGLDMHHDASEVTVNICLGKDFEGANLRFCGHAGAVNHRKLQTTYQHRKGYAVIHLGRHRHGADDIKSGERLNLIMWLRSSVFRLAAGHGVIAPDGYPRQSETDGVDECCLSRSNDFDYEEQLLNLIKPNK